MPAGAFNLGRWGLPLNVLAVAWLAFETVNIAWPRESLAPPDAPFYQVWAAPLVLAVIGVVGLAYLVLAKPQRKTFALSADATLAPCRPTPPTPRRFTP